MVKSPLPDQSKLVKWSIDHPSKLFSLIGVLTILALGFLPFATIDTNPKNMLPPESEVRSWNHFVDETFDLYQDVIVVGIAHTDSVLNIETLERLKTFTQSIQRIPGVAARDVTSLASVDNITSSEGNLEIKPLLTSATLSSNDLTKLKQTIFESNLFVDRIISKDTRTTVIYVPLEAGANGKHIADSIREQVNLYTESKEQYYITGDPVARDTFGALMFKLMAKFSPIAGAIMCIILFIMFRRWSLVMTMMAVAMVSIAWSMAALIGFGYPIHIMSSMAPVFLMAIATDSIHIFNEFNFRSQENQDRRSTVLKTMAVVARPVKYTAIATAAGFAVLMLMEIVPVKVFGGMIVFGTLALRLLSFSMIPAILMKIPDKAQSTSDQIQQPSVLLKSMAQFGTSRPLTVVALSLTLVLVATVGMFRIIVDNNQIEWFSSNSKIRQADQILNQSLGGTAVGYIVAQGANQGAMKSPESLRYLEQLQHHLDQIDVVGKTFSVNDYIKRIHQVLHDNDPAYYTIPDNADTIGQYLFLFSMAARPSDLNNVIDYPFQNANIWIYLKSWDARAMQKVIEAVEEYQTKHPSTLLLKPAGTTYFNVVWNQEVLWDMVKGFSLALLAVFLILVVNFRSWRWALVAYVPLAFTIVLIYGAIGWIGKDFDMPISVLSCLSLGMAVDFAIHFISRFRQKISNINPDKNGYNAAQIKEMLCWTAGRPGKGIFRNAILFSAAFSVMLAAPLTPYITVGAFIVSMMLLSALSTIILLPALITLLHRRLLFIHSPIMSIQLQEDA